MCPDCDGTGFSDPELNHLAGCPYCQGTGLRYVGPDEIRARKQCAIILYGVIFLVLFVLVLMTGCASPSSPDDPSAPPPAWEEPAYVEDITW